MEQETELDPNEIDQTDTESSFDKLKKLQIALKEEGAIRSIFNLNKEEIMKDIELHSFKYYQSMVKIKEIFDFNMRIVTNKQAPPIQYELAPNAHNELPECCDPLLKMLYYFHDDYKMMLQLISHCDKNKYDDLAHLVSHSFYQNIFSWNTVPDRLLILIYFLLEKEIDSLRLPGSASSFLDLSFLSRLFRNMTRKEDIKSYLSTILTKLILKVDNDEEKSISLDPSYLRESYNKDVNSKDLSMNSIVNSKKTPMEILTDCIAFSNCAKIDISNDKDDLLNFVDEELKNNPEIDIDELDDSLLENIKEKDINKQYKNELSQDYLVTQAQNETNDDMQLYLLKQMSQFENDPMIFTNRVFIKNITDFKASTDYVLMTYKKSFLKVKQFIDNLMSNLLNNISSIPYPIKCIALMILRLIKIKFPSINNLDKNAYLGKFFFEEMIIPILYNPVFNGMITDRTISNNTRNNMITISKIILRLYKGTFFNASKENEFSLTLFNHLFIEIMPSLMAFFDALTNTKLPKKINKFISDKEKGFNYIDDNTNDTIRYSYDFFKEFPQEKIEHQSICITWSDFFIFYNAVKSNEQQYISDPNSYFARSFKKITFHENFIQNKMETCQCKNRQTYILLSKICYSDEFKNKMEALSREEHVTFETNNDDEKNKETSISFNLERVKYCISTIILNLNNLNRENFFIANTESTAENFVMGLNRMIEMEGFSDMLNEKCIPLAWFGLYLKTNIESLPDEYKENNYAKIYEEILKDSHVFRQAIKNDELLNYIYLKLQNCKRLIMAVDKTCENLSQVERHIKVSRIVQSLNLPVEIKIFKTKQTINKITIGSYLPKKKDIVFFDKNKCDKIICQNINDFINKFPNIAKHEQFEVFDFLSQLEINKQLENYYEIIYKAINETPPYSGYSEQMKKDLYADIEHYIQVMLDKKLLSGSSSLNDLSLNDKMIKFKWIQPKHLIRNVDIYNVQLTDVIKKYLAHMFKVRTPLEKLKAFGVVNTLVRNNIAFNTGENDVDEENCIDLLVYIMIKLHPTALYSNLKYIELFLTKYQEKRSEMFRLNQVIEKIQMMNISTLKTEEDIPKDFR